jgi:Beta-galactosidase/beta-glucuronidase
MNQLISRFGKNITYDNVLGEYPRPMLRRDSYLCLNGVWKYEINKDRDHAECADDIIVPFSPETYLSRVQKILKPDEYLHYRKVFRLPEGFVKDRVLLHFGAVDQECEVKLNGRIAGSHKGGYLPFEFDITESLTDGDNIIEVLVVDKTEQSPHARGKQRLRNKGICSFIFYTPQSGIWKSVWLESVSKQYITGIKITPDFDASKIWIRVDTDAERFPVI